MGPDVPLPQHLDIQSWSCYSASRAGTCRGALRARSQELRANDSSVRFSVLPHQILYFQDGKIWQDYFFLRTLQCEVSFRLCAGVAQCSLALLCSEAHPFPGALRRKEQLPGHGHWLLGLKLLQSCTFTTIVWC